MSRLHVKNQSEQPGALEAHATTVLCPHSPSEFLFRDVSLFMVLEA